MGSELLILGMHRVGLPPASAGIRGLFITPKILEFQVSMLRSMGFRFLTLNQALTERTGKRAVLTFDDGYADNYSNAYPILRRIGVPATVFVITSDVGRRGVVWSEASDNNPSDMLDWTSINDLQDAGWEIGSHAHRHIHLARYTRSEQEQVIHRSLDIIEENTGTRPLSFAYPYGSYNDETKSVLKSLGVRYAVTTNAATAGDPDVDVLELHRTALGGRHFYHYLKNLLRTRKAVGSSEILRGLCAQLAPTGLAEAAGSLFFPQINK